MKLEIIFVIISYFRVMYYLLLSHIAETDIICYYPILTKLILYVIISYFAVIQYLLLSHILLLCDIWYYLIFQYLLLSHILLLCDIWCYLIFCHIPIFVIISYCYVIFVIISYLMFSALSKIFSDFSAQCHVAGLFANYVPTYCMVYVSLCHSVLDTLCAIQW